ncbi:MAG TPA: DUF4193 family protein [Actinomycetota bacterium]|nr:DUF4193 family protein [Actinomycetota bacterium]
MSADDIDTERDVDEDEDEADDGEPIDDLEPTADDIAEGGVTPEPGLGEVESIQDLLEKQETQEAAATAEEEEATPVVASKPGEALEAGESRVVPIQSTEFTCSNCFLVKHRSQLADKKKMLCRDCA